LRTPRPLVTPHLINNWGPVNSSNTKSFSHT
jgi:hypothetical protein